MVEDIRNYVNPHPSHSEAKQLAYFGDGTTYVEDRSGKVIERLIKSLRRGSIVRVVQPFLLAPVRGRPQTRRNKWADRVCRIKAAGALFLTMRCPQLRGAKLAMVAYEEIASSGRGAAGRSKSGRPQKSYSPEQLIVMEREWHSKKHKTRDGALKAIRNYGIEVKREWLYVHFPVKT